VYQHCGEKHLHRYLAEYDFRFNHGVVLGYNDDDRWHIASSCERSFNMEKCRDVSEERTARAQRQDVAGAAQFEIRGGGAARFEGGGVGDLIAFTVIASEAKQSIATKEEWIASSLTLPCANAFAFVAGNDD
jgi:hypothetical protein